MYGHSLFSFGWLVDWLVGWLVVWSVGWMDGWMDGWLVGWMDGWLVGLFGMCRQEHTIFLDFQEGSDCMTPDVSYLSQSELCP